MTLCKYAHEKGLNRNEYNELKKRINQEAEGIFNYIKSTYKPDTGIYYDIKELFPQEKPETPFIIEQLKNKGVEFTNLCQLWRY